MLSQTEVIDPIVLASRVAEAQEDCCCCCGETDVSSVPEDICRVFDDTLVDSDDGRKLFITIGLFTIVRLERDTELIVHVVDYCIPSNECVASSADNSPCDFFDRLRFPVDEFFPPEKDQFESLEGSNDNCCCN